MSETEVWKEIPGYEGIYAASNLGRIKRVTNAATGGWSAGRIMKYKCMSNGYGMARLSKNGKVASTMWHRLITMTFLGVPENEKIEVNHKNGVKSDNRIKNLEWVTRSENSRHAYDVLGKIGPRGERSGHSKLTNENVLEIRRLYANGGYKQSEIALMFGVSAKQVSVIITRTQWAHI